MNPFPLIEVKNKTPDQLDKENKLQGVDIMGTQTRRLGEEAHLLLENVQIER